MPTNHLLIALLVALITSCDCKPDAFGERPFVEIPIRSYPDTDVFKVGDTIWWAGQFSKEVTVRGVDQALTLESFNFFTQFNFQDIASSPLRFDTPIGLVPVIGDITRNTSVSQTIYDIDIVEETSTYSFKFGVVLLEPGKYVAGIDTNPLIFRDHNHPALYACGNRKRRAFTVTYQNSSTDRSNYETFLPTIVDSALLSIVTYERYEDVGAIFFEVVE